MSLKSGLCWIYLLSVACTVSADILSNENSTWHDANSRGNFATPKIQVNNSTFIVNIPTDLNDNEEAWVGYYKKETAFAYIECGFVNNAKLTILLPVSRNSPGLCYSMCNKSHHTYVGLNKDKVNYLSNCTSKYSIFNTLIFGREFIVMAMPIMFYYH
ncbi:uncharacterized protein LOC132721826 [Ruditapes philippinarum]|uniref:uncharacterized protein LOC132721826 n=1 Tax=Ruditapes philippinarum TaxID=129788 RepID=UPI00295B0F80|nr:uncharacterized protein LOC132721826 [Ruditapes philippinarum]